MHGTHGEVIGLRAIRDHVALRTLPRTPYVVTQRHLRHVGEDCLVAFDANLYSVPARKVRPRRLVEVRATKSQVVVHATAAEAPTVFGGAPFAEVVAVDRRHRHPGGRVLVGLLAVGAGGDEAR
ncbi:Mu transposase domain-containing protein [Streptomyces virginiae]